MLLKCFLSIVSLLLSVQCFATAGASSEALEQIMTKYRSAKLVEMSVDKTVTSELLGRQTLYKGRIFLGKEKFRWENDTPEKTLLVFDGQTIWSEQNLSEEFGGPVQVAKGKVNRKNRSHILLSALLGEKISKNFKTLRSSVKGNDYMIELKPIGDDLIIKSLVMVLDSKGKILKSISYKDDIGNLTKMDFLNVKFLDKEKNSLFNYKPPKGAQVTEL